MASDCINLLLRCCLCHLTCRSFKSDKEGLAFHTASTNSLDCYYRQRSSLKRAAAASTYRQTDIERTILAATTTTELLEVISRHQSYLLLLLLLPMDAPLLSLSLLSEEGIIWRLCSTRGCVLCNLETETASSFPAPAAAANCVTKDVIGR